MNNLLASVTQPIVALGYQNVIKPILFTQNPEKVHDKTTHLAQALGENAVATKTFATLLQYQHPQLQQIVAGITFSNPVGLAAGFDYEARLTQLLPSLGFGFETIGTITNHAYEGNPAPMLGRLPRSKSLLVNKGFKNLGAKKTIVALSRLHFALPIGVSIGRTNTRTLVSQKQSIADILAAFTLFESSSVRHAYYELNISCPNLYGDVSFYSPKNLSELLRAVDALQLSRPVFIKMPIEKDDVEVVAMLEVIARHSPVGVIFGNLQKDRTDPSLVQSEIEKYPRGNFSGKPTFERSNELIALTYKYYGDRLIIIGCGGIFSAEDAYLKILSGATLVQLITGMVYQGPQLISEINRKLVGFLKRDGFKDITQAIGSMHNNGKHNVV